MWKAVKKMKSSLKSLYLYKCIKSGLYQGLYDKFMREAFVKGVEYELGIESSDLKNLNITSTDLDNAAEMFVYLLICPHTEDWMQWFRSWHQFYDTHYTTQPPDKIVLTRNRIMKTLPPSDNKVWARNIFKNVITLLNLNHEHIKKILPNGMWNESFQDDGDDWTRFGFGSEATLVAEHTNHPVHILNPKSQLSPSAFIPFCDFGGNMSTMGVKIDQFAVPVCNSFQAKILNDQLCYEVDLNNFSNKSNIDKELKQGFSLIMDYNEDRQITFDQLKREEQEFSLSGQNTVVEDSNDQIVQNEANIYLDTIGLYLLLSKFKSLICSNYRASNLDWGRRVQHK